MGKIPKSWREVTLGQYVELESLPDYDKEDEQEILKRKITEAHILTGLSVEEIDKLPFGEMFAIKDLLNSKKPEKLRRKFKLNGVRYHVQINPMKLDSDKFLSILNLTRNDPIKRSPQIILNICKPYKRRFFFFKKYYSFDPGEYIARIDDFKDLTMDTANPILVFFCFLFDELLNHTQEYSEKQLKRMNKRMERIGEELKAVS